LSTLWGSAVRLLGILRTTLLRVILLLLASVVALVRHCEDLRSDLRLINFMVKKQRGDVVEEGLGWVGRK